MGGQLRTPKLSLADAGEGGGPSSDIVTTFALFPILRLPLVSKSVNTKLICGVSVNEGGEKIRERLII